MDIETANFVAKDIVVIKESASTMMLESLLPHKEEIVDMFCTMLVLVNKCFMAILHRLFIYVMMVPCYFYM